MSLFRFDRVELLLAESSVQVRTGLRGALRDRGFRVIQDINKLDELRMWVTTDGPDLIIADVDLPGGDVCRMFHDIRHHRIGSDPFVPIIATSQSRGMGKVRQVIDSGADDLLVKPVNIHELLKRVKRLVERRKPFVVTSDYIGPDRRETPRSESGNFPIFKVPNKLWVKAAGSGIVSAPAFRKSIDMAISAINEQKMTCHAHQLFRLAEHIVLPFHSGLTSESLTQQVNHITPVAEDLARRVEGTRFAHIAELCSFLIRVVNVIHSADRNPENKDLDLLLELSRVVDTAFSSDEKVMAFAREITRSVDMAVAI